jgi:hypothetical protein
MRFIGKLYWLPTVLYWSEIYMRLKVITNTTKLLFMKLIWILQSRCQYASRRDTSPRRNQEASVERPGYDDRVSRLQTSIDVTELYWRRFHVQAEVNRDHKCTLSYLISIVRRVDVAE